MNKEKSSKKERVVNFENNSTSYFPKLTTVYYDCSSTTFIFFVV